MIRILKVILPALFLSASIRLGAETRVYRETMGDREEIHAYTVTPTDSGYTIRLVRQGGGTRIEEEMETDSSFSTLKWTFHDSAGKTDLYARRRQEMIDLTGVCQGKPVLKTFKIDSSSWRQLFSIDFEPLARSPEKSARFWSIGTAGPGKMKIAAFTFRVVGEETIEWRGKPLRAVRVRIALAGLLSLFWHGDYWFEATEGRYLRYRGKGTGGALSVKELREE
jgi:hypothetical protein